MPDQPDARTKLVKDRHTMYVETHGHTVTTETYDQRHTYTVPADHDPVAAHQATVARMRHLHGWRIDSCTVHDSWTTHRQDEAGA
ncbi:hypothetical protein [Streptomyces sp. NPDC057302]|uniref:hypothetical protein n=1 Tax=Streptomyces sp. NPDC057302 TaxID=3346094 RepID=UPI0036349E0C